MFSQEYFTHRNKKIAFFCVLENRWAPFLYLCPRPCFLSAVRVNAGSGSGVGLRSRFRRGGGGGRSAAVVKVAGKRQRTFQGGEPSSAQIFVGATS